MSDRPNLIFDPLTKSSCEAIIERLKDNGRPGHAILFAAVCGMCADPHVDDSIALALGAKLTETGEKALARSMRQEAALATIQAQAMNASICGLGSTPIIYRRWTWPPSSPEDTQRLPLRSRGSFPLRWCNADPKKRCCRRPSLKARKRRCCYGKAI